MQLSELLFIGLGVLWEKLFLNYFKYGKSL